MKSHTGREQIKGKEQKEAKGGEEAFLAFDEECPIWIIKAGLSSEMFDWSSKSW